MSTDFIASPKEAKFSSVIKRQLGTRGRQSVFEPHILCFTGWFE